MGELLVSGRVGKYRSSSHGFFLVDECSNFVDFLKLGMGCQHEV